MHSQPCPFGTCPFLSISTSSRRKSPVRNPRSHSSRPPTRPRLCTKPLSTPHLPPATKHPNTTAHYPQQLERQHKDLLVDAFHHTHSLRALLRELSKKGSSDPLSILEEDGDWSGDQFWFVVRFLKEKGRAVDAVQVFDVWSQREVSRANLANYTRMIQLLSEEGLMGEAVSVLGDMEGRGLAPNVVIYNAIVNGFARVGEIGSAMGCIEKMGEVGLRPIAETYNGLIRAYGDHKMYDEMSKCVKRMCLQGCSPNEVTYNLLIVEYARGGLLEKMEGLCRTLLSNKMKLLPSTSVAMLEAYADLGILEKVEKCFRRIYNSNSFMKESLIRKVAFVYIENLRFVRLEELGNEIASMTGRTALVWCILMLASARLLSRKGLESIVREMEGAQVAPDVTFSNIQALAYMKMKDFWSLDVLFSRIGDQRIKPDMVTFGVFFESCDLGYDGTRALEIWRRMGFLDEVVEMRTDPLVLAAYGKGQFIYRCEEVFSDLRFNVKEKKIWTYGDLLSMIFKSAGKHRGHN